jgi:hypothetical protein
MKIITGILGIAFTPVLSASYSDAEALKASLSIQQANPLPGPASIPGL